MGQLHGQCISVLIERSQSAWYIADFDPSIRKASKPHQSFTCYLTTGQISGQHLCPEKIARRNEMSAPKYPDAPVRLSAHNAPINALAFSSGTGQYLLTGSSDRTVKLLNPATGRQIQSYSAHGYEVLDLAVSGDNARFASVGGDKTVFLWDVATAQTLRRFLGHAGRVNACAFGGAEDSVLCSGSFDGTVKVWDCKSRSDKPIMTFWGCARCCLECLVYDLRSGEVDVDVIAASGVTSVSPSTDGEGYLVSTLDSTLRFMDRPTGKCLQTFRDEGCENETYRVRSTFAMGDSLAVSGTEDGALCVFDVLSGSLQRRLWHRKEGAKACDGAATKKNVVSAVAWNQMLTLKSHSSFIKYFTYHPSKQPTNQPTTLPTPLPTNNMATVNNANTGYAVELPAFDPRATIKSLQASAVKEFVRNAVAKKADHQRRRDHLKRLRQLRSYKPAAATKASKSAIDPLRPSYSDANGLARAKQLLPKDAPLKIFNLTSLENRCRWFGHSPITHGLVKANAFAHSTFVSVIDLRDDAVRAPNGTTIRASAIYECGEVAASVAKLAVQIYAEMAGNRALDVEIVGCDSRAVAVQIVGALRESQAVWAGEAPAFTVNYSASLYVEEE
ncbi:hypothetical protein Q7P37_000697 [Cladosporium fusiforme]